MNQVEVGELILLTIKRIGINGEGIGFYRRQAIFVENAIPGEVVEVLITKTQRRFAYGEITKFKEQSPLRIDIENNKAQNCVSCSFSHLQYQAQIDFKADLIKDSFARYYDANKIDFPIKDTIPMQEEWHYRNYTSLPTRHDGESVVVGIYEPKTNHLVYVDEYVLENKLVGKTIKNILTQLTKANISVYNPRYKQGSLRYLTIRASETTQETQVIVTLFGMDTKILSAMRKVKGITSLYYAIDDEHKSELAKDTDLIHLHGKKTIFDKVGDMTVEILPDAFYPLNSLQLAVIYNEVKKIVLTEKFEKIVTFNSGIGLLENILSESSAEIRAINPLKANHDNCLLNVPAENQKNVKYYFGDFLPRIRQFKNEKFVPDLLIVNPTRTGLELNVINYIQNSMIDTIIYISNNPSTLAKNVNHLQRQYSVKYLQPIDTQPQTIHFETICVLERK